MSKLKAALDALFNSPYLDKTDVAAVVAAGVTLGLPLNAAQQGASVLLISLIYIVARKIEAGLSAK
jgi:hypothetical protein